jgi:hypothetical protein
MWMFTRLHKISSEMEFFVFPSLKLVLPAVFVIIVNYNYVFTIAQFNIVYSLPLCFL